MALPLTLDDLTDACTDESTRSALRVTTTLEPAGGPGTPVKPAVYEGGRYQLDKRWASPDDAQPAPVVVVDNVPSQANRLEAALRRLVPPLVSPVPW